MRKIGLRLVAVAIVLALAACSGDDESGAIGNPKKGSADIAQKASVTLKFFTALPDRTNGAGKVEQDLIDAYMAENPNVKIEVETLQDEPYKSKIKIYAATNALPDIMQTWGQPSFIKSLIDNDLLLELNPASFMESEFVPGSTEGFSKDGKLYGLPRSTDFLVIYYNRRIFADSGVQVPRTMEELKAAIKTFRNHRINPIAVNGMDLWTLPIWFEYEQQRQSGDFGKMDEALDRRIRFTDGNFLAAAEGMQQLAAMGAFADGYLNADYGAARNLFGQGQAAMYLMGNWESGLATDGNFSEDFRRNVGAFPYPASGKGKNTDTALWFGGGYSISKTSKYPDEAIAFLKYFFSPDHWAKLEWESGAGMPASSFEMTGKETKLQQQLVAILRAVTSSSGTPILDEGTPEWKDAIMNLHSQLLTGQLTPVQFAEALDSAAERTNKP
ncbi:extracellular solute-binding protein [Cohnella endophytica]|uniref:Extracellular solute-binding protein n=1 Tax=Cohnella endophytica TaxID=2419778 RepID=A0A494Y3P9_9BACL|nr:extracellular solute-binding protein [Cohnella endophytica]RKP57299.1 extracellular solute-binding protein [Cohnella endophytica]